MNPLDIIKSALPWIGTALGGPLGAAAATFVGTKLGLKDSTVEGIKETLAGRTPEELAALKNLDNTFQLSMAALGYQSLKDLEEIEYKNNALSVEVIKAVNETMKVEAATEHWPSYSWRPFIGFSFGLYIASMWLLPLFGVKPVELSTDLTLAVGGILGVASYFRGRAQADPDVQNTSNITQKG